MRMCPSIRFIQHICVEFTERKFNVNYARKIAGDLQMRAHAFAYASTYKRKFNATQTKFHLSPTLTREDMINI